MGAFSSIMQCIPEMNDLSKMGRKQERHPTTKPIPLCLIRMLSATDEPGLDVVFEDNKANLPTTTTRALRKAREAHLRAFKTATLIYYYQTCERLLPRDIAPYVSEVLECLSAFLARHEGNPTLWPAFIAGVEVCTKRDRAKVMQLFERTSKMGMMNQRFQCSDNSSTR